MKYINSKLTVAILAIFCAVSFANAQEVIKDSVKTKILVPSSKKAKSRWNHCNSRRLHYP